MNCNITKEVEADGVKTYKEIINTLFDGVDLSSISISSDWFITINQLKLTLGYRASTHIRVYGINSSVVIYGIDYAVFTPADTVYRSMEIKSTGNTFTDLTNTVPPATTLIRLRMRV